MCGFAGEIAWGRAADLARAERMAAVTAPRGPDGHGSWARDGVALAHRRLAIIDVSERGHQPMVDEALGLAIVFNGCIYNHRELHSELEGRGYAFRSTSDTEVILAAWAEWGEACLERLVGMFAFALTDLASGRLTLVRDRLGIKPLYLAEAFDGLSFASTLQAVLAGGGVDTSIDPVALHHYLTWHAVVPAPRTILAGVRKLPPATLLRIEPDGTREQREWWSASYERDPQRAEWSAADWRDALRDALRRAVERRMVSDVPVGVLLSGGLDSSLIAALIDRKPGQELATFSIGFPDGGGREGNEFEFSDLMAAELHADHHKITVGREEVLGALAPAVAAMSEPMVSHDNVAFFLLAQEVSRHVKVVQSGQGADEVLAGYHWYQPLAEAPGDGFDTYRERFFDRPHAAMAEVVREAWRLEDDVSGEWARERFSRPGAATAVDRGLRLDTEVMLVDDPVKRVDNMTMAWGLEARVPFLDHDLVELMATCPPELKLAGGGKGILKEAARGTVPDAVIDRPKGSFPVPAVSHLEGYALELVRDALLAPAARDRGLFEPAYVNTLLRDPNAAMTPLDGNPLWQLGMLEVWLQALGV